MPHTLLGFERLIHSNKDCLGLWYWSDYSEDEIHRVIKATVVRRLVLLLQLVFLKVDIYIFNRSTCLDNEAVIFSFADTLLHLWLLLHLIPLGIISRPKYVIWNLLEHFCCPPGGFIGFQNYKTVESSLLSYYLVDAFIIPILVHRMQGLVRYMFQLDMRGKYPLFSLHKTSFNLFFSVLSTMVLYPSFPTCFLKTIRRA